MQREQRRDHQAAPGKAGGPLEDEEHQHGVQRVQQHVFIVRAGGIEAENRDVGSVGNPSQRMPVTGIAVSERPDNIAGSQAVFDVRVVDDVLRIVDVDEGMAVDRRIDGAGGDDQQQAENDGTGDRIPGKKTGLRLGSSSEPECRWKPSNPPESRDEYSRFDWLQAAPRAATIGSCQQSRQRVPRFGESRRDGAKTSPTLGSLEPLPVAQSR